MKFPPKGILAMFGCWFLVVCLAALINPVFFVVLLMIWVFSLGITLNEYTKDKPFGD